MEVSTNISKSYTFKCFKPKKSVLNRFFVVEMEPSQMAAPRTGGILGNGFNTAAERQHSMLTEDSAHTQNQLSLSGREQT